MLKDYKTCWPAFGQYQAGVLYPKVWTHSTQIQQEKTHNIQETMHYHCDCRMSARKPDTYGRNIQNPQPWCRKKHTKAEDMYP